MRVFLPALAVSGMLLVSLPSVASVHPHHHTSAHPIVRRANATRSVHHTEHSYVDRPGISTERATEIQTALIKQGYLTGDPTGAWDASTIAAMQKLQSDNGWQTKLIPDSRALIKLGLGPNSDSATASTPALTVAEPPAFN